MPRHVDPEVERRIVLAARKLWHKGGEKGLSMRAVARAAGTNTPAVYRRFRNRAEILRALVELYQKELFDELEPCRSLQEMAQCYLRFALRYPKEYGLLMSAPISRRIDARPNLKLALHRCAEWFGGRPEDHVPLAHAIVSLIHGHAMLKISGYEPWTTQEQLQGAVDKAVDILVTNQEKFRK
jgi:AcrR family transcriptional regulator